MISAVPSVSSVHVELDDRLPSTTDRTDETTKAVSLGDRRTCDVVVRKIQGVGNSTFVLSVENYNDFRSRCE